MRLGWNTDCKYHSKDTHFRWNIKWRLELFGALRVLGETPTGSRCVSPIHFSYKPTKLGLPVIAPSCNLSNAWWARREENTTMFCCYCCLLLLFSNRYVITKSVWRVDFGNIFIGISSANLLIPSTYYSDNTWLSVHSSSKYSRLCCKANLPCCTNSHHSGKHTLPCDHSPECGLFWHSLIPSNVPQPFCILEEESLVVGLPLLKEERQNARVTEGTGDVMVMGIKGKLGGRKGWVWRNMRVPDEERVRENIAVIPVDNSDRQKIGEIFANRFYVVGFMWDFLLGNTNYWRG